jgi:hypothetical protein
MISAKRMSEAIRMKRKKVKDEGLDNMLDTAPGPQMNPQDILNNKQKAQIEETIDAPEKSTAPSDPADEDINATDQEKSELAKRMKRVQGVFDKLKP